MLPLTTTSTKFCNHYPERFLWLFQLDSHLLTTFHWFEFNTKRHVLPIAASFDDQLLAHVTVDDKATGFVGRRAVGYVGFVRGVFQSKKRFWNRRAVSPDYLYRRDASRPG